MSSTIQSTSTVSGREAKRKLWRAQSQDPPSDSDQNAKRLRRGNDGSEETEEDDAWFEILPCDPKGKEDRPDDRRDYSGEGAEGNQRVVGSQLRT